MGKIVRVSARTGPGGSRRETTFEIEGDETEEEIEEMAYDALWNIVDWHYRIEKEKENDR